MRKILIAIAAISLATPAWAHEPVPTASMETGARELAQTLGDPVHQQELTRSIQTLSDVLLDLPLAPIARPLAEAAGSDPRSVDPDLTLRRLSPRASAVPGAIGRELPRAMDSMARMSDAMARLAPALQSALQQFEDAMPRDVPR